MNNLEVLKRIVNFEFIVGPMVSQYFQYWIS